MGKLRISFAIIVVAAAIAFQLSVGLGLVTNQPGDTKLYEQIAKNMIEQGTFSAEFSAPYPPTLIRTPGYPLFLAGLYEIFGIGDERSVRVLQSIMSVLICLMAALIAAEWTADREQKTKAALCAFVITAFCPFTTIFSATVLCETPTMFLLAASLLAATYAIKARAKRRSYFYWATAGLIAGTNVLFRPDSGLFAFGIGLTLVLSVFWGQGAFAKRAVDRFCKGLVFALMFALPLIPWTIRNEYLFGVFQPLSPAHAEMPGEFVPRGYLLWIGTWIDDAKYIDPLIWGLEEKPLKIADVPPYAFSSDEERARVAALFDRYNNSDPDHPFVRPIVSINADSDTDQADDDEPDAADAAAGDTGNTESGSDIPDDTATADAELNLKITPEVDAEFAEIGRARVERDPWRYYLWLPAKRSVSMWFDTHSDFYPFAGELLPLSDLDSEKSQGIWLTLFALMMWLYTIGAVLGSMLLILQREAHTGILLVLCLAVCLPRAMFFGTVENPEPRYLVELFIPALILCAVFVSSLRIRRENRTIGLELKYGRD